MTTRRKFLKGSAALAPGAILATPALAQSTIKWRMQTYAGPALAEHVIDPAIKMFNTIAGDKMQIELFYADQLVPTGELFQALQRGTIDVNSEPRRGTQFVIHLPAAGTDDTENTHE